MSKGVSAVASFPTGRNNNRLVVQVNYFESFCSSWQKIKFIRSVHVKCASKDKGSILKSRKACAKTKGMN